MATTNINELAWGVEFETTMPITDQTPVGHYHAGLPVAWLPVGWKAECDSSINPTNPNIRKGVEFVSPKLRGAAGLAEAMAAANAITDRGGRVNWTCGLHITVEWTGDAMALARLISLVGNHEKGLFASTGTRRREQTTYAKKVKLYRDKDEARLHAERDRYHMINLTHLASGRNRIEFRLFAGTLSPTKIAAYVQICLGLVELAITGSRNASWEYAKRPGTKRSFWERTGAGDGENEVSRLIYRLGWSKGWYNGALREKQFGVVEHDAALMKAVKAELRRLGQKYDRA